MTFTNHPLGVLVKEIIFRGGAGNLCKYLFWGYFLEKREFSRQGPPYPAPHCKKYPGTFFIFARFLQKTTPHITPLCKQNNLSNQQYTIALGKNVRNSHRMDIKFKRKIVRKYYYSFFDLINQKIKSGVRPILLESCHIFDVYMSILYF